MNASKQVKSLLAGLATVAVMGAAMAQGNPPNPAVKNAPEGAGQRSSQGTPMGTTGTPTGAPMTNGTSSMSKAGSMGTASAGMSNSTSNSAGTTMAANDTMPMAKHHHHMRHHMRKARADRN